MNTYKRRENMENMLKKFDFIKGDTFGAIIAGIIALPQALAFGVASGYDKHKRPRGATKGYVVTT